MTPDEQLAERSGDFNEWPTCANCGHAGEDHEDGVCYKCVCVNYEPQTAEDILSSEHPETI